jgi:hypothetical protein
MELPGDKKKAGMTSSFHHLKMQITLNQPPMVFVVVTPLKVIVIVLLLHDPSP